MDIPVQTLTTRRPRTALALAGALSLGGLVAVPGLALAAQGDNDVVIDVIETASPSVVTMLAPAGSSGDLDGLTPGDFE